MFNFLDEADRYKKYQALYIKTKKENSTLKRALAQAKANIQQLELELEEAKKKPVTKKKRVTKATSSPKKEQKTKELTNDGDTSNTD